MLVASDLAATVTMPSLLPDLYPLSAPIDTALSSVFARAAAAHVADAFLLRLAHSATAVAALATFSHPVETPLLAVLQDSARVLDILNEMTPIASIQQSPSRTVAVGATRKLISGATGVVRVPSHGRNASSGGHAAAGVLTGHQLSAAVEQFLRNQAQMERRRPGQSTGSGMLLDEGREELGGLHRQLSDAADRDRWWENTSGRTAVLSSVAAAISTVATSISNAALGDVSGRSAAATIAALGGVVLTDWRHRVAQMAYNSSLVPDIGYVHTSPR